MDAARAAVLSGVAQPLGLTVEDAARGILAIADNHMVGAMRVISVERGHDPRDFTLVPFGGAGPLHGCALADLLGISRVMIPRAPGVLCADGLLAADLKAEFSQALPQAKTVEAAEPEVAPLLTDLEAKAAAWFDVEGVAPNRRRTASVALMRYHGQGGELSIAWPGSAAAARAAFAEAHKSLYGFSLPAPVELVTLRVEAVGLAADRMPEILPRGETPAPYDQVPVTFGGGVSTVPVVDRTALGAGATFAGPMILTQLDTTTLVPPGWTGTAQSSGAILLEKDAA